jgi:hypothetical protein
MSSFERLSNTLGGNLHDRTRRILAPALMSPIAAEAWNKLFNVLRLKLADIYKPPGNYLRLTLLEKETL